MVVSLALAWLIVARAMMKRTLVPMGVVVTVGLAMAVGCGQHDPTAPLVGDYRLKRSSAAAKDVCLTGGKNPDWLCESTGKITQIGWNDQFIVAKINVTSKEFLVIDVREEYYYVVGAEQLDDQMPEVRDVEMHDVAEVWHGLRLAGV